MNISAKIIISKVLSSKNARSQQYHTFLGLSEINRFQVVSHPRVPIKLCIQYNLQVLFQKKFGVFLKKENLIYCIRFLFFQETISIEMCNVKFEDET